jgi:hypothetical protein
VRYGLPGHGSALGRGLPLRKRLSGDFHGRGFNEVLGLLLEGEQGLDFAQQFRVAGTGLLKILSPPGFLLLQSGVV